MSQFQIVAVVIFVVMVLVAYGSVLSNYVIQLLRAAGGAVSQSVDGVLSVDVSRQRVNDMVLVAELRNRLAEVGCTTGVDACTLLLKAIIEHPDHADGV